MIDSTQTQLDAIVERLDRIGDKLGVGPTQPSSQPAAPAIDMNLTLHQARGARLRGLPRGAQVFLSAGCSGRWFFEWIETCYGDIPRHIGVEYYTPKPPDLPANVEWIENTCSDMSMVQSSICDIVFSGQNLEHLWPEEVVGFLLEAARVTKLGGLLVMDSPNRGVTEALRTWSHPEHTVEVTVTEAAALIRLAGFEVAAVSGIWLCRDPRTGVILPHPYQPGDVWSVAERLIVGTEQPEHAFIWWIEARRTGQMPDEAGLRAYVGNVFGKAWPERVRRMMIGAGEVLIRDGTEWVRQPAGVPGPVIYGPYMPLPAGLYRCRFHFENLEVGPAIQIRCDVFRDQVPEALETRDIILEPGRSTVEIEFKLLKLQFGMQFRCFSFGQNAFLCRKTVDFEDVSDRSPLNLGLPPLLGLGAAHTSGAG